MQKIQRPTRQQKAQGLTEAFVRECRTRLLESKADLLNRARQAAREFESRDRGGSDEGDLTMDLLAENAFLSSQQRIQNQLMEIEAALARIEQGSFGICEETEEPIEEERLRVLPWTRLSIEGAEIREALQQRFARG